MEVVNPLQAMGSPSKVRFAPLETNDSHHALSTISEEGDEEEGLSLKGSHLQRSNTSEQEKVVAFYRKFNPTKLDSVPAILAKYRGREDELLEKLKKQYNVADI